MRLIWDESVYSTGDYSIDSQHKELFRRINWFLEAQEDAPHSTSETLEMMEFVEEYVVEHFKHEEQLMALQNFVLAETNRNAHQAFKRSFAALKREFAEMGSSAELYKRLERLLVNWIHHHIIGIDVQFKYVDHRSSELVH